MTIWSIRKYKYTNANTDTQIQIHKYKYTNTNTQIQIHKYKYTNTNAKTQIQICKYKCTNTNTHKYQIDIRVNVDCSRWIVQLRLNLGSPHGSSRPPHRNARHEKYEKCTKTSRRKNTTRNTCTDTIGLNF